NSPTEKALWYHIHDSHLFRKGRIRVTPRRVVCGVERQQRIIKEMHDRHWAGHQSVRPTFQKVQFCYFWPGMWAMVRAYVNSCEPCQLLSQTQFCEELHLTALPTIHGRWFVDIVIMPKAGRFRYLILAQEDVTDWVEGRALHSSKARSWCTFIF